MGPAGKSDTEAGSSWATCQHGCARDTGEAGANKKPKAQVTFECFSGKRMRDPILQLCFRDQEGIFLFFFMFQVFSGNLLL